jgi:AraC-like DNA-binding protein
VAPVPLARHLLRARDLVDGRYHEPLDLRALASEAGVSPRHFGRSFRGTFGETPHQYLLSRRLERARHLLRTSELSVAEVCLEVGFSSVGSFTSTFRRHTGCSPTEYRRRHRGPAPADRVPSCYAMTWARGVGVFGEDSPPDAG